MCTKPRDDAPAPPNPDHDQHAAGLYQTIALRFYARYIDARHLAAFRGEDLPGAEPILSRLEASERYQEAVAEWVFEPPASTDAVLALVEFAGVVAADKLVGEAVRESGPCDEKDALHQVIALNAVGEWLQQVSTHEWLDRRREAYGPTGMPRKGGGL
jgi:hypothetical protein